MIKMNNKKKVVFLLLIIGFIFISYLSTSFNIPTIYNEKTDLDEEFEDFKDKLDKLRTAGFQYTGLSVTVDSDLYQNTPYDFYGQFWDTDNLEEAFTQGWLEYSIIGDDEVFEESLSVPDNLAHTQTVSVHTF